MGLRKHGVGEVIPDDQDNQRTASKQEWGNDEERDLHEENED